MNRPAGDVDPLLQLRELDESETRAKREQARKQMTGLRARLNLLLAGSIQAQLQRVPGNDGVEVLASVAGVEVAEVWKILAGDYRLNSGTWHRIERILVLCAPVQNDPNVALVAKELFGRIRDYSHEIQALTGRLNDFQQRRRAAEVNAINHNRGRGRIVPDTKAIEEVVRMARLVRVATPARCVGCGGEYTPDARGEGCGNAWCSSAARVISLSLDPYQGALASATGPADGTAAVTPPAPPDVHGHDQRPDPLRATSPAEFMAMMRAYRIWAGNPSLREMEERCGKKISYSTFRNMLGADTIPSKLVMVEIVVKVLGGTAEDVQRWATAWRSFAMQAA